MGAKDKGSRHERALANKLWEMGCAVVRSGSSGGGVRTRFAPDIVALCKGTILVIEAKYRSKPIRIYLNEERARALMDFAERAGGSAYLAVKYGKQPWKAKQILAPEKIVVTPEEYEDLPELRHIILAALNKQLL